MAMNSFGKKARPLRDSLEALFGALRLHLQRGRVVF